MAAKGHTGRKETLRIVLLGKTGAGKSTLGNAITGLKTPKVTRGEQRDEKPPQMTDPTVGFKVGRGVNSKTKFCDWRKSVRKDLVVEVTDTPGLCDTHLPEKEIYKEVAKSVAVAQPGPHVIIFVLRCDRPFTWEEHQAYNKIKQLFSEEMNKYLFLVFNGLSTFKDEADTLEGQRQLMEEDIKAFGEPLSIIVREACGRVFGISNELSPQDNDQQITDLLLKIQGLVASNGGTYYRTELTEQIKAKVEELAEEEAAKKQMSESEARDAVNTAIITEEVNPGFWPKVTAMVSRFAQKIKEGLKSVCSVM